MTDTVHDDPNAPILFFESAPVFGCTGAVIDVMLEAKRSSIGPAGVINDHVTVAHLRGNIAAFINLRAAIDRALAMAASPLAESDDADLDLLNSMLMAERLQPN